MKALFNSVKIVDHEGLHSSLPFCFMSVAKTLGNFFFTSSVLIKSQMDFSQRWIIVTTRILTQKLKFEVIVADFVYVVSLF